MRPSARRPKRRLAPWLGPLAAILLGVPARAENAVIPDLPATGELRGALDGGYRLQVFVNGRDRKVIAEFRRAANGAFYAKRGELRDSGVLPPPGPETSEVALDSIPGLSFRYDEVGQAIYFTAAEAAVAPNVYDANGHETFGAGARSDFGAALNYDLYSTTGQWSPQGRIAAPTQSLSLDARLFSPLGVIRQTGILGATLFKPDSRIRLDTSWEYQDEAHDLTARAGDAITSSLPWTRPIRIGGAQVAHDYATRPDLVTAAAPTLSGSAAVPTTVDVYVGNMKIFERNVESGPFQIDNLPLIGGGGEATVKVLDASGKAVSQTLPFFANADALRPGVFEFSAEFGYPRLNYAVRSFDYLRTPVGSGTFRYGLNRFVTLEGHAEGGAGVLQGGAGALFNLFDRASLDASLAGSKGAGGAGLQIAVSARTAFMGLMFEVASQRTFRAYSDLAAVTTPNAAAAPGAAAGAFYVATSAVPPRAYDRFSVAVPNLIGNASFNLSLVNLRQADGARSRIGSVGFSKSLPHGVALNANAYADLTHKGGYGAFAGINVQFGGPLYLNHQAGLQNGALTNYSEVGRGAGQEAWTYGWRAFDAEGAGRYSGASGTLMTPLGRASVSATQYGFGKTANAVGTGEFSGSLAMVGAALAAGPATGESFALVKTGAAGVTVLQDNRVLGVTGPLGTMLVPNLRPFQDNKIGIDPASLPGNAVAAASELILRPKSGSGVGADFAVNADPRDAEVILVDIAGKPIGAGALAKLQGQPNGQTVGYDGRVYFTGLASHNVIEVRRDGAACSAGFDYAPRKGGGPRPTIGPVACR